MSSFGFSVLILVVGVALSLANSPQQAPVYYRPSNQQIRTPWPQQHPQPRPQSHSYRQNPLAPQPQPSTSKYVHHSRRIVTFPANQEVFRHNFKFDGHKVHEERAWVAGQHEPFVSRAISSSYDPMFGHPTPQAPMNPQPAPALLPQSTVRNVEHQNPRRIGSELSNPIVTRPNESNLNWDKSIASIVDLIKTNTLKEKNMIIGSPALFKSTIIGHNPDDEAMIRSNLEKSGLNFTNDENSCRPVMTTIKFGSIDNPEVIYHPATVEVKRCPLACFSWQFDCIPTDSVYKNFTAAVYTIGDEKITRDVQSFSIETHTSCTCSCQSFASCLATLQFSPKRLSTR